MFSEELCKVVIKHSELTMSKIKTQSCKNLQYYINIDFFFTFSVEEEKPQFPKMEVWEEEGGCLEEEQEVKLDQDGSWKESLLIKSSGDFWYLRISRRAMVPGLYVWGFLTPPVACTDFLAALKASCFLGAFPPCRLFYF